MGGNPMNWQVGQQVMCDRPEQSLTGCFVVATEPNSVKIVCPAVGIVVSGQQIRLEEMGWRETEEALVLSEPNH
jgi:hypothetical protein